jgi:hypothetical protein
VHFPHRKIRIARRVRPAWSQKARVVAGREGAVRLVCDDCRHEIKAASLRENQRHFCDQRCREKWRRRVARFYSDRRQPVAFGDA